MCYIIVNVMKEEHDLASVVDLLRRSLTSIGQRLEAIEKVASDYADTISARDEAAREKEQVNAKARTHFLHDTEKKRGEEHEAQQTIQKWIAYGTWAAVVAACIYAGIAYHQLRQTRQLFVQDQRPILGITSYQSLDLDGKAAPLVSGKPFIITVNVKNVGKSTALKVLLHRHVVWGEQDVSQIRSEPPDQGKHGTVLEPGNDMHTSAMSVKDTYSIESIGVPDSQVTAWDGSLPVVIFGRITYNDRFGNSYCTAIAETWVPGGDFAMVETLRGQDPKSFLCPQGKQ